MRPAYYAAAGLMALVGGVRPYACKPEPTASPPPSTTTSTSSTTSTTAPPNGPVEVAVIGDTPYGADRSPASTFEGLVDDVAASGVRWMAHLGDIKEGTAPCTDAYYDQIHAAFEGSAVPVVYTPGDNDWTDCHLTGFDPLERLAAVRQRFFAPADDPLGAGSLGLTSQGGEVVENRRWTTDGVVFGTVHVVVSGNGTAPWTGSLETPANAQRRTAEVQSRTAADVSWIDAVFDAAAGAPGVVLIMHANTWGAGGAAQYAPIVDRIGQRAAAFGRPVLVIQGSSHTFLTDHPVPSAPNLTRIVVQGETVHEWLRLRLDPQGPQLFTWERVTR